MVLFTTLATFARAAENSSYWAVTTPPDSVYAGHLVSGDTRYEAGVTILSTPISFQDAFLEIHYQLGHFNPVANADGQFIFAPLEGGGGSLRVDGADFFALYDTLTPNPPKKAGTFIFELAYPLVVADLTAKANAAADIARANARQKVQTQGGDQAAQDAAAAAINAESWAGVLRISPALLSRQ